MSSPTSPKSPVSTRSGIERRTSTQLDEELLSTAQDILNSCPRFRILVLGKTGAGKSSLINAAFNVDLANVSHGRAGVSDINEEITSENNSRFVLHDSQGFAPGEVDNFNIVKTFIEDRAKMPQMKDKLHAIWFCMEIPTEGGALFEVADQQFLELPLGDVPIIVVFTKYDLLVRKFEREAEIDLDSFDEDEFDARNAAQAEEVFQTTCVGPLTDIRMGSVPYMKVSKHPQYKSSLAQLVELTQENIDKAVWLIWALAQRASADVKIQASIEVGKKKYWRGLASSLFFPGKTLIKCLSAIHRDIVIVWNFNDPNAYLEREKFKAIMSHLVEDLVDLKPKSTNSTQISAGTVASVAVALAGGYGIENARFRRD